MTYLEQFEAQQLRLAYDQFRPEFAGRLFPRGFEEAAALAKKLAALFFPNSDLVQEHYQTCFDFFTTYALARLMGYNEAYAARECENKYGALSPLTLHLALELCQTQLRAAFPHL